MSKEGERPIHHFLHGGSMDILWNNTVFNIFKLSVCYWIWNFKYINIIPSPGANSLAEGEGANIDRRSLLYCFRLLITWISTSSVKTHRGGIISFLSSERADVDSAHVQKKITLLSWLEGLPFESEPSFDCVYMKSQLGIRSVWNIQFGLSSDLRLGRHELNLRPDSCKQPTEKTLHPN